MFKLVVAGAHMSGLALNYQLLEVGATLDRVVKTATIYRMYDLGGIKPALIREQSSAQAYAFEVEVWSMPMDKCATIKSFRQQLLYSCLGNGVKAPLAIGDVLLEDNTQEKGFVGEAYGVAGCPDISEYSGWRAYLNRNK